MAVFHSKFRYMNKFNTDYDLINTAFDAINGEKDSFLSMEPIYTENTHGTYVYDYGAKFSNKVVISITMVKKNYMDLTVLDTRRILRWLTGHRQNSWLDFYNQEEEHIYSFIGRFTDVKLRKMDGRVIGVVAEFTTISPFAYSPLQIEEKIEVDEARLMLFNNQSDDDDTYVYPSIIFAQANIDGNLKITNTQTNEFFEIRNLVANEIINIDSSQIIYSNRPTRIFGEDCNFQFVRFTPGINQLLVEGKGELTISYREIYKVADALIDINSENNDTLVTEFDSRVTLQGNVNDDDILEIAADQSQPI